MADTEDYFRGGQYVYNKASGYIWYLFEEEQVELLNTAKANGKENIDHKDCDICKNDIATTLYDRKYYCDDCIAPILKRKKFSQ